MAREKFIGVMALGLLIAGCSPPRIAAEDFCHKEGRSFSKKERYLKALTVILENEKSYSDLHYVIWKNEFVSRSPKSTNIEIANQYLLNYPKCCSILRPAFLNSEIVDKTTWDNQVYEQLRRDPYFWVVDVHVWKKVPPIKDAKYYIDSDVFSISSCNDKVTSLGVDLPVTRLRWRLR